jgi:hypothetical protein
MEYHLFVHLNSLLLCDFADELQVFLLHSRVEVVVLGEIGRAVPKIVICLVVSGGWDVVVVAGITLVFSTIVHAVCNYVPTHIPVRHFSLEKWTARSQS